MRQIKHVETPQLSIAYEDNGAADATPVVLLHGFPYDPRAFDDAVEILVGAGMRTIVPYLRGYGETRFRSASAIRSGEQAALGQDLRDLLDALRLQHALLAGFDWGGRAACVVAALWPERVSALVTCGGYAIQDIAGSAKPAAPEQEARLWYQYYFHLERGRAGLADKRRELSALLWRQWSPSWQFTDATFAATAASFDNPDFVDVVVHSYRHRTGYAPGDPLYAAVEAALAKRPVIRVPTITIHGAEDGVLPAATSAGHAHLFSSRYERRVLPAVGHNPPQEAPREFASAILALRDLGD